MGELRELSQQGDTKIIWDVEEKAEVKVARDVFDKLKKKGYYAYQVKGSGKKGEVIDKFDPAVEKIIMAPPMAGG